MLRPTVATHRGAPRLTGKVRFAARSRLFRKPEFVLEVEVVEEIERRSICDPPGGGAKAVVTWWRPLEAEDLNGRAFIAALEAIEP